LGHISRAAATVCAAGRVVMASAALPTLRGAIAARQGFRVALHGQKAAVRAPHLFGRGISSCVEKLETPRYIKVPALQDETVERILADMPDLALSGTPPPAGAAAAYANLTLDQAIETPSEEQSTAQIMPEQHFAELPNGCKIVAVDRQGMCSSVGLFIHTGSRYQPADMACIPHVLELMAFKASAHGSHLQTLKTLEQLGAAASCRVGREDILYHFDTLREYVPVVLPLMMANVLCPSMLEDELAAARDTAVDMRAMLEENTEGLLGELMHVAAYSGNTLGYPLYAEAEDTPKFTVENVTEYIRRECTPERMIIVGINIGFEELCKYSARSFADCPPWPAPPPVPVPRVEEKAVYTGGDYRMERQNPLCHLMIGWEVEGGWNGELLAAVTVLQMFLGGGKSFSTGGPGKGMHTRLYTEVLNRHYEVESCQASSVMYADSGLFTIYATCVPHYAGSVIAVLARIFKGVNRITAEELHRAKNLLKSSIHMNLEMRAVLMEDIGRQLVLSGKVGTAQEFGRMVDAVTVEDLVEVLGKCLDTNPTVVGYGAIEKLPSHEAIKDVLKNAKPNPLPETRL